MLQAYLSGLPLFLAYIAVSAALMATFVTCYVYFTPYSEIRLIRAGNRSAAVALLGAMVGFAMPMTTAMRFNGDLLGFVIWAALAALVQFAAFTVARLVVPTAPAGVERDDIAAGIWLGGVALVSGLLNSASMTP